VIAGSNPAPAIICVDPKPKGQMPKKTKKKAKQPSLQTHEAKLNQLIDRHLSESLDLYSTWVDPYEAYCGPNGEPWLAVGTGTGTGGNNRPALDRAGFRDEQELARAREFSRLQAETNEFAINAIENRISYGVGCGHSYHVSPKKGVELAPEVIDQTQAYLDNWVYENDWGHKQAENQRRLDRDGETIIRKFKAPDGLKIRYVEPWQLKQPAGMTEDTFGIKTDPDDIETVLGYWIDDELVKPNEIQHRKANVDSNVKRGIPLLYPVRENLRRIEKIYRNMAAVADIQTAIAIIRKHKNTTASAASTFRGSKASYTKTNQTTGQTRYGQKYEPGTILDASDSTEYEFPAQGLDASKYTLLVDSLLRAVAARMNVPEFMLTANASNANYASTMVAEGPAVKSFERLQATMARDDLKLLYEVISHAVDMGQLPQEALDQIEIQVGKPSLTTRDKTQETNRDKVLFDCKILSPQTFAQRNDLDYEQEKKNIADAIQPDTKVEPLPTDPTEAALKGALESNQTNFKNILNNLLEEVRNEHQH